MLIKKRLRLTKLALLLLPTIVLTDELTALQEIMQGLRDNVVEISDGLLTDDYALVARGAMAIAKHPQIPPEQEPLVAQALGPGMPVFKQFDVRVHDLSLEISAAAEAGDRATAISGFQDMIEGCFACHAAYKDRVASVLKK